jgi:hypothetical protein
MVDDKSSGYYEIVRQKVNLNTHNNKTLLFLHDLVK